MLSGQGYYTTQGIMVSEYGAMMGWHQAQ